MQITEAEAKKYWKNGENKSQRIFFGNHIYNGDDNLERMLKSISLLKPVNTHIIIDDKTTDNSMEVAKRYAETSTMTWVDDFAYAKNLAVARSGVQSGDWFFTIGDDMEITPETAKAILEFVKDPLNVAAQFWVVEYNPETGTYGLRRKRALLYRYHPYIYWQKRVHEEWLYSFYTMFRFGIKYTSDKELPFLGDEFAIKHYGYFVDEKNKDTDRKIEYYLKLQEADKDERASLCDGILGQVFHTLLHAKDIDEALSFLLRAKQREVFKNYQTSPETREAFHDIENFLREHQ